MASQTAASIAKQRLTRQSTWSALAIQFASMAALLPAYATPLGVASAVCGLVKLFLPEDATAAQTVDKPPEA